MVQIKLEAAANNGFVTNKVENEYQLPGGYLSLPPSPTSRTTSSRRSAWCRSWAMSLIQGYAEMFFPDTYAETFRSPRTPPAPLPRKNMILRCCQNWNIWRQNVQICFDCYVKIWLSIQVSGTKFQNQWIGGLLYVQVDDLTLMSTCPRELQAMLHACQEWSVRNHM